MSYYKATIGLEIHAQLNTETKLFSSSPNIPLTKLPNSIVSPVDAAHPGTLPTLNRDAVKKVIEIGLAINGNIAKYTEWDRKNYFYPDIPKAYQISQYQHPLVTGGSLLGVGVTRIHLEEDTGKSTHVSSQNDNSSDYSLVDLNRAGMPLMELVTEPIIHSPNQAVFFAKELQRLMRYLDIGDANLEKGEMRIEANISVSNSNALGTKVEVKNLGSFRSVEKAIRFEIERQTKEIKLGNIVAQETRGWDEDKENTYVQRSKESAHDYRYFPDPDMPKLYVSEVFDLGKLQSNLPELPSARRELLESFKISAQQIEMFLDDSTLYELFIDSKILLEGDDISTKKIADFITTNYVGAISTESTDNNISAQILADILRLTQSATLSSTSADILLAEILRTGKKIKVLLSELDLRQSNDKEEIQSLAQTIINQFPDQVTEFKAGNENILKFLIGQGMKLSSGKINPQILTEVIQDEIGLSD